MPSADSWTRRRTLLFMGLLFIIALLPRLVAIDRYITPDELTWVYRSVLFREALRQGQWAGTLTAGHPGVTTTWLGAGAITAQMILQPAGRAAYDWITHLAWLAPDNAAAFQQLATFLTGGRLVVAVVNSLGLAALFPLLSGLYNRPVAVLATLLLALDPFYAGLSGLLHVDGLMTTFAMLSLAGLAFLGRERRWRMALFSGSMAGLAILSKSPAILLLPLAALFLLGQIWWPGRHNDMPSLAARFKLAVKSGVLWLGACLLTLLLLWPALWVNPLSVFSTAGGNAGRHIEEALRPTFFMGQVAFEHGPWFYPVNLVMRLSPVVFAGLLVAALLLIIQLVRLRRIPSLPTLLFCAWVVLFLVGISLAAKKFDRYALPVIPPLVVFASLGWYHLRLLIMRDISGRDRAFNGGAILLLILQGFYLLRFTPYPLAAYNILLGGPPVAAQVVSVGWGEGISAAGQWLDDRPGAESSLAVADSLPALAPLYSGQSTVLDEETLPVTNYTLVSLNSRQVDPAGFDHLMDEFELLHTVTYAGIEQAWVFNNPQPEPVPVPTAWETPLTFGDSVELWAAEPSAGAGRLYLDVLWGLSQPAITDYAVVLTVHDPAGNEWSRLEMPLLNEVYFRPVYWEPGEQPHLRYLLALPPAAPPGEYTVQVALFAGETGERLPLRDDQGTFLGVAYTTEPVIVAPTEQPVSAEAVLVPLPLDSSWMDGALLLLGTGELPPAVTAGDSLPLDVFWHAPAGKLPDAAAVRLQLGDTPGVELPLSSGYPAGSWRAGETIQEKYRLPVAPTIPAGEYPLTIAVCAEADPACSPLEIGRVTVNATDRNFTLPAQIGIPLDAGFSGFAGETLTLLGVDLPPEPAIAGETIALVLHWQMEDRPAADYTAFVHVLDTAGGIVAQGDQWPGGLPPSLRAAGEVIRDEVRIELPPDLPAGEYAVIIGLYTAEDGVRRPVLDAGGNPAGKDHILIPFPLNIINSD